MSGGHEKIFSILGPKLSGSKAQQYYRDKILQIRVEEIDYDGLSYFKSKYKILTAVRSSRQLNN